MTTKYFYRIDGEGNIIDVIVCILFLSNRFHIIILLCYIYKTESVFMSMAVIRRRKQCINQSLLNNGDTEISHQNLIFRDKYF